MCLGLGFKRLVTLDITLYGASLMLEFVTLVVLRIREPELKREFRVPGGLAGAICCGIFPLLLLSLAIAESGQETGLRVDGLVFGLLIITSGFLVYLVTGMLKIRQTKPVAAEEMEGLEAV